MCICIVVFAMTCTLWPRSLWFQERVAYTTRHLYFAARTNPGTLTLQYHRYPISPFEQGWHAWHLPWNDEFTWPRFRGGFGFRREEFILGFNEPPDYSIADKTPWLCVGWVVDVPFWAIALTSIPLPLWMTWRKLRQRSRMTGKQCIVCGYDLRASPSRCPECGTLVRGGSAAE
jgi:hypothetical protein